MFKVTPRLDYARETGMLPIVQDAGWASGRVVKVPKILNTTGIRTAVRMVQALYIRTSPYAVVRYRPRFARLDGESATENIKINSAISHKSESHISIYITIQ